MKYSAISLIGKPNVGKSTIINKIFNEQVSIVNMKPQTTRNQIAKIYENSDYKILFVDTPGFHLEKNE
ncbi:50S ribosome-binding GTPase, partial [bacterium]|nr:50S ribosome-binding GTPase [bacterium]